MILLGLLSVVMLTEIIILFSHYQHKKDKSPLYKAIVKRGLIIGTIFSIITNLLTWQQAFLIGLFILLLSEIFIGKIDLKKSLFGLLLVLFGIVQLVVTPFILFWILTPMLYTVLWIALFSVLAIAYVLFAEKLITKRLILVPFTHGYEDVDFPDGLSDRVYMAQMKKMRLPINALLLGFRNHKMVILSNTLLASLKTEHVKAIIAHELGHHKHRHLIIRFGLFFIFFAFISVFGFIVFRHQIEPLIYITYFMILYVFYACFKFLLFRLLHNQEFEADAYAKSLGFSQALAEALHLIDRRQPSETKSSLYQNTMLTHPKTSVRIKRLLKDEKL